MHLHQNSPRNILEVCCVKHRREPWNVFTTSTVAVLLRRSIDRFDLKQLPRNMLLRQWSHCWFREGLLGRLICSEFAAFTRNGKSEMDPATACAKCFTNWIFIPLFVRRFNGDAASLPALFAARNESETKNYAFVLAAAIESTRASI